MRRTGVPVVLLVVLALTSFSCSTLKEIQQSLTNLSRLKFKIDSVNGFTIVGIPLAGKTSVGLQDGAKLLSAFYNNRFPASFTLNVAAVNPNDGTGGTPKSTATLTSFAWTLVLDSTQTISGDISDPILIPGTGETTVIPLAMNLDLVKFFKDKGYDSILNLALALGGANKSASHVMLRARPTVRTDLGPIQYPGEITIIDKEFRAQ
jgi:hypothetical protein